MFSLQRAGMWKRISAFLFDFILGGVAATLFAFLLSGLLGYDGYVDTLEAAYAAYGEQYDVDFHMSLSDHDALTRRTARAWTRRIRRWARTSGRSTPTG